MAETIADLLVHVGADITGMQTALGDAEQKITTFGNNLTAEGGALMKLGAPLVGFGALASKVAGDFEAQMNILAIAARGGGTSLEDLRNVAIKAGSDVNLVGVSASDVATMMTNFTKAGLDTNEMLGDMQGYLDGTAQLGGVLRGAIDLAAASELSLDDASKLAITTMATFGLTTDEVGGAMNNYVQAADASVASVGDLAAAMENIGPTVAAYGWTLGDVNTALALLSTRGIEGAEAGTALKSAFNIMLGGSKDVTEALAALNISLYDSQGNMKPLEQIIKDLSVALGENATVTQRVGGATAEQQKQLDGLATKYANAQTQLEMYQRGALGANLTDDARNKKIEELQAQIVYYNGAMTDLTSTFAPLQTATHNMTEEERNAYVQTLAGTYGQKALNTLLQEGTIGWDNMKNSIAGAATMQETANARTVGFNAAMENLKSTIETFLINVGTPLIRDVLTPLVGKLSEVMSGLGGVNPEFVKWGVVAGGVVTALGGLLVTVGQVATGISGIVGLLGGGAGLTAGFAGLGAALAPLLPILAAVAAAVGVLALAWNNNWFGIRDTLTEVWERNLRPALQQVVAWLQDNIPRAIQAVVGWWNSSFLPAVRDVYNFLNQYIIPIVRAVADVLGAILGKAVEALAGLWQKVLYPSLVTVWNFINTTLGPVFQWLADKLSGPVAKAVQFIQDLFELMGPALTAIKNALTGVAEWFSTLADKIRGLKLPDWLTPGSPTPLEIALLGILEAIKLVAGGPWGWIDPLLKLFGGGGSGGGVTTNINVVVGPGAVVVEGADPTQLASAVGEAIWRALQALTKSESTYGAGAYPPAPW